MTLSLGKLGTDLHSDSRNIEHTYCTATSRKFHQPNFTIQASLVYLFDFHSFPSENGGNSRCKWHPSRREGVGIVEYEYFSVSVMTAFLAEVHWVRAGGVSEDTCVRRLRHQMISRLTSLKVVCMLRAY